MFEYINSAILPLGFIFLICSIVGVIGNGLVVLCTLKTRRFRSPCHILICLTCLADAFHISGQFPFCVHLFGNLTSTQSQCFFMLLMPIVGVTTTGPLMLGMGVDRLLAIQLPMTYRYYQKIPVIYMICHLILPILYSSFFVVYGFIERDSDEAKQIICAIPLSLNGPAFQLYTYSSGVIYSLVLFIYLSVFVTLKVRRASSRFRNVFRSIAVTVSLMLFGWATTTCVNIVSYELTVDLLTIQIMQMYAGITVNIAAASNIFIFYAINPEYRVAIKSLLGCYSKINAIPTDYNSTSQSAATRMKTSRGSLKAFVDLTIVQRRMTVV